MNLVNRYFRISCVVSIPLIICLAYVLKERSSAIKHFENKEYAKAFELFKKVADQGNEMAQYNLKLLSH